MKSEVKALAAIVLTLSTSLYSGVQAQEFPDGPISLVVGFDPGGESDTGARAIAPFWEEQLGVPVVIDSRPGAAMQIALEYTWAKPHDGYTVLWHNQQYLSALELTDADLPYSTDQWVWLDVLENDPAVVTVREDSEWESLDELIESMRSRPNEITLGLLTGSVQLLGCKTLFEKILKVDYREVPQQSGSPMRTSLVGGHLDAICTNAVGSYALGDQVRTLAVFKDSGSQLVPESEPVNEVLARLGVDERIPDLGSLRGAAVPRDFMESEPERFKILYDTYQRTVNNPEYQAALKEAGRHTITSAATNPDSLEIAAQTISNYNAFFIENDDVFLNN